MIRLKGIKTRGLLPPKSMFFLVFLLTLSSLVGLNGKNLAAAEVKEDGFVKIHGNTPIVAAGSNGKANSNEKHESPSPINQNQQLVIKPSKLSFSEQSLGIPRSEKVEITNYHSRTVQLTSVTGNVLSFHPALLQPKVIDPGETISFEVMFLPRELGHINGTLYVYTSIGTMYYDVDGEGTPNLYRLYPLTRSRLPVSGFYQPIITMYNPYNSTLQVTEIYSSGGDIMLELVNGAGEGSRALWEIRPFETKPIMRLSFMARSIQTHSGYIRVKTNYSSSEVLIIPVFIEVTKSNGVFISRDHCIDFGIIKHGDPDKRMPLNLVNTFPWDMEIASFDTGNQNSEISFKIAATVVPSNAQRATKVATVIFNSNRISEKTENHGRVVVKLRAHDDRREYVVNVDYRVIALNGYLYAPYDYIAFRPGRSPFKTIFKNVTLMNNLTEPVIIYDAKLPNKSEVDKIFTLHLREIPYIVPPNSTGHVPLWVEFHPTTSECMVATDIRIYSNASTITVPLYCFDGSLAYNTDDKIGMVDGLDFGVLNERTIISKSFQVLNHNPVKITVLEYTVSSDVPDASVQFLGFQPVLPCNQRNSLDRRRGCPPHNKTSERPKVAPDKVTIDSNEMGLFGVTVASPKTEGTFIGEVLLRTSFTKEVHVPISYKVVLGSLDINSVKTFLSAFPHGVANASLSIVSHFKEVIKISAVHQDSAAPQVYFDVSDGDNPVLIPDRKTVVGHLFFDPLRNSTEDSNMYLGLKGKDMTPLKEWMMQLHQIIGNVNIPESDFKNYQTLKSRWKRIQEKGTTLVEAKLKMETNESTNHYLIVEGNLIWPGITRQSQLQFQPTLVSETTVMNLLLENPSSVPVVVQAVPFNYYPQSSSLLQLLRDRMNIQSPALNASLTMFTLPEAPIEDENVIKDEHLLGSDFTVTYCLAAYEKRSIRVAFSPKLEDSFASVLIIRNNLTIIEVVSLEGRGVTPQLEIDGHEAGGSLPITFEYTEKMLSHCDELSKADDIRLLQKLMLNNTSPATLIISSMSIDGFSCQGYGYHINNCDIEFELEANSSKSIEISLTPDFTLSKITAFLHVSISGKTTLIYPLLATLPHHMLSACYAALPRPAWEKWISKLLLITMLILLVLVMLLAVSNAKRINEQNKDYSSEKQDIPLGRKTSPSVGSSKMPGLLPSNALYGEENIDPPFDLNNLPDSGLETAEVNSYHNLEKYFNSSGSDSVQESRPKSKHLLSDLQEIRPLESTQNTLDITPPHCTSQEDGEVRVPPTTQPEGKISKNSNTVKLRTTSKSQTPPLERNKLTLQSKQSAVKTVYKDSTSNYTDKDLHSSEKEKTQARKPKQIQSKRSQPKLSKSSLNQQLSEKTKLDDQHAMLNRKESNESIASTDSEVATGSAPTGKTVEDDKSKKNCKPDQGDLIKKSTVLDKGEDEKVVTSSLVAQPNKAPPTEGTPANNKKELHQQPKRDRKKKFKIDKVVIPPSPRSDSDLGKVPLLTRQSLESLTSSSASTTDDHHVDEELDQKALSSEEGAESGDVASQNCDHVKIKTADSLDEIHLDSPVPTRSEKSSRISKLSQLKGKPIQTENESPTKKNDKKSAVKKAAARKTSSEKSAPARQEPDFEVSVDASSEDKVTIETPPETAEISTAAKIVGIVEPLEVVPNQPELSKEENSSSLLQRATSPHELAAAILSNRVQSSSFKKESDEPSVNVAPADQQPVSKPKDNKDAVKSQVTSSTKSSVKGHPFSAHLSSKIPKSVVSPQGEQVSLSSTAAVNATSVNIVAPLPPEIAPTTTTSAQTTPSFIPSKIPYVKPTSTLGDYMPSQKPDKPNVPIAEMQIKPQVSSYKPRKLPDNTAQSLNFAQPDYMSSSVGDQTPMVQAPYHMTHPGMYQNMPYAVSSKKRPSHLELPGGEVVNPPPPHMGHMPAHMWAGHAPHPSSYQQPPAYHAPPPPPAQTSQYMQYGYGGQHIGPFQSAHSSTGKEFARTPHVPSSQPTQLVSQFTLLNKLHHHQQDVPGRPLDLGGEYLPISSKLATPSSTPQPSLNLAPGKRTDSSAASSSLSGMHQKEGTPLAWHKDTIQGIWNPESSDTKSYGLFGSSSIWGPQDTSNSYPWINALHSQSPTPSSCDDKKTFPENSPFE